MTFKGLIWFFTCSILFTGKVNKHVGEGDHARFDKNVFLYFTFVFSIKSKTH